MHSIGQEGQNNFLTDQMSRFWLSSRVRPQKVPKKRHFGALSIDFPAKVADHQKCSKSPVDAVLQHHSPGYYGTGA